MDDLEWVRQAILKAYPNPERIGCPPPEAIEAMARKTIPMTEEEEQHLFHCSPCFATYLGVRNQIRRSRLIRIAGLCAAGTLLLAGVAYFSYVAVYPAPAPQQFAATFNLQERPVFRGQQPAAADPSPFVLPRGVVHLSVTLPFGSEPGLYQVQILQERQTDPVLAASGQAVLEASGSTILTVNLNSARLQAGRYEFAVRKDSAPWSYSPLVLR